MSVNFTELLTQPSQLLKQVASSPADSAREAASAVADTADQAAQFTNGLSDQVPAGGSLLDTAGQALDQVANAAHGFADHGPRDIASQALEQLPGGGAISSVMQTLSGTGDGDGDTAYSQKMRPIIKEAQDVAVPRRVAYDQWTQLEDLPDILKAVKAVEQNDAVNSRWTIKIGPSTREWDAEITEQVPDSHIAWRSRGGPQHFGVVSFHELDRALSRVQLEMEYHPTGVVEKIGNLFLAARKRSRRELRLFKHHMENEGEATGSWRGEIRAGKVAVSHEEKVQQEEAQQEQAQQEEAQQAEAQGQDPSQALQQLPQNGASQSAGSRRHGNGRPQRSPKAGDNGQQAGDNGQRPTREELYRKAQDLNIRGRSQMNVDELQQAVQTAASA